MVYRTKYKGRAIETLQLKMMFNARVNDGYFGGSLDLLKSSIHFLKFGDLFNSITNFGRSVSVPSDAFVDSLIYFA